MAEVECSTEFYVWGDDSVFSNSYVVSAFDPFSAIESFIHSTASLYTIIKNNSPKTFFVMFKKNDESLLEKPEKEIRAMSGIKKFDISRKVVVHYDIKEKEEPQGRLVDKELYDYYKNVLGYSDEELIKLNVVKE